MKTTSKYTVQQVIDAGHDEENALKVIALCQFMDCEPDDLKQESHDHYGLTLFERGSQSYAIGTDEEADSACVEYCRDSVWAFNASFILDECGLPSELEEAFQSFQSNECEGANDAMLALVEKCCKGGIKEFTQSAISADGRGHFLSGYDGNEGEEFVTIGEEDKAQGSRFYIYRTN